MAKIIDYAKENPGKVVFAHPGLGTVPYMMMKALESATGIQMKGVPFKGLAPGVTAVVGGHVDVAPAVLAGVIGHQKAGKLRILGLFAGKRMELAPDVPTVEEDGIKVYPQLWTGIFVPKGIDAKALKKLKKAFAKAAKSKKFVEAILKAKQPVFYLDSKAFKK